MHVFRFKPRRLFDAAPADGAQPGGAPAAAAPPAAPAPAAAAGAPAAGAPSPDGAPGGGTPAASSLMARGAAPAPAGAAPAGSPAPAEPAAPAVAEKFLVKNEAGEVDWQASALKQAQAYTGLEQRMGAGDAPPKTADDYAPDLPQGWSPDRLKADPLFAGFLKGAHAKGMNNAQVSWALSEFQQRMDMMRSPEAGEAELRKIWGSDQQMQQGLTQSYRGSRAFAEDADHAARLDEKFGNDPDYIRLMARVGKEIGEDKPVHNGLDSNEANTLEDLVQHPAYNDAKHPEHARVTRQVKALYDKKYAGQ